MTSPASPSLFSRTSLGVLPFLLLAASGAHAQVTVDWQVPAQALSIAHSELDSEGGIYSCSSALAGVIATSRVDRNGQLLWTQTFRVQNGSAQGFWLDVDSEDNVVVAGYQQTAGGGFLALKYDPAGNLLWSTLSPGGEAFRVGVGPGDDVYLTGRIFGNGWDYKTVKLDSDGNVLWTRFHDAGNDEPQDLEVADDGVVAVTGTSGLDFLTVVYDTDGNLLFADQYPGLVGGYDVDFGPSGDVYVCGTAAVTQLAGAVLRYRRDGSLVFASEYNGATSGWDSFRRMDINANGVVVAVGQTPGSGLYLDWGTVAFDDAGDVLWSAEFSAGDDNDEWATAVDVLDDGEAIVVGRGNTFSSALEAFVVRYAADGTALYEEHLVGAGTPVDVYADPLGGVTMNASLDVLRIVEDAYDTAGAIARNGLGGNPVVFTSTAAPVLGGTWSAVVDASSFPLAGVAFFVGYDLPLAGVQTPFGEVLVAPEVLGGVPLLGTTSPVVGGTASVAVGLPLDGSLVGLEVHTQAGLLGGGVRLLNGVDLLLGN